MWPFIENVCRPCSKRSTASEIHTPGRYHNQWKGRAKGTGEGEMSVRDKAVKEFISFGKLFEGNYLCIAYLNTHIIQCFIFKKKKKFLTNSKCYSVVVVVALGKDGHFYVQKTTKATSTC